MFSVGKDGKRILVDPGLFSFIENRITPKEIGRADAILLTHKHPDHFEPSILKQFLFFWSTSIFTIEEIGEMLKPEGITYEKVKSEDAFGQSCNL